MTETLAELRGLGFTMEPSKFSKTLLEFEKNLRSFTYGPPFFFNQNLPFHEKFSSFVLKKKDESRIFNNWTFATFSILKVMLETHKKL